MTEEISTWKGEMMVGFLIDKLDRAGNRSLQKNLAKLLKNVLNWKKPAPIASEFNTFMVGASKVRYEEFDEVHERAAVEPDILGLIKENMKRSEGVLRERTALNRSELEAHQILAKFCQTTPSCPANPLVLFADTNQTMTDFVQNSINHLVDNSWMFYWSFDRAGDERIVVHDGTYRRRYTFGEAESSLHTFDELLILNFAHEFLVSLNKLAGDVNTRINRVVNSFKGETTKIHISDPDLASEAFRIIIGDLVAAIDAYRTCIRQVTRIEEVHNSAKDEFEILAEFKASPAGTRDLLERITHVENLDQLKAKFQEGLETLLNFQKIIRDLEKEAVQIGTIHVNLEGFHL
ncbi:MAG: hypothetical protein ACFFCQ_13590, partial [Promethearchaeota archaeon]